MEGASEVVEESPTRKTEETQIRTVVELYGEAKRVFSAADVLLVRKADEKEPYRFLYQAADEMCSLITRTPVELCRNENVLDLLAVLHFGVGKVRAATAEGGRGFYHLAVVFLYLSRRLRVSVPGFPTICEEIAAEARSHHFLQPEEWNPALQFVLDAFSPEEGRADLLPEHIVAPAPQRVAGQLRQFLILSANYLGAELSSWERSDLCLRLLRFAESQSPFLSQPVVLTVDTCSDTRFAGRANLFVLPWELGSPELDAEIDASLAEIQAVVTGHDRDAEEGNALVTQSAVLDQGASADLLNRVNPLIPVQTTSTVDTASIQSCYFLAQEYSKASALEASAVYCHKTIERTFSSRKALPKAMRDIGTMVFNSKDFMRNCLSLQLYYRHKRFFRTAFDLLAKARAVWAEEQEGLELTPEDCDSDIGGAVNAARRARQQDLEDQEEADVQIVIERARGFNALYALLDDGDSLEPVLLAEGAETSGTPDSGQNAGTDADLLQQFLLLINRSARDGATPSQNLSSLTLDSLFESGSQGFERGLGYYVLDGYVTNHCQILLDYSLLLGMKAEKAPPKTKVNLNMRRAAMLDKAATQLNREFYAELVNSLMEESCEAKASVFYTRYGALDQESLRCVEHFEVGLTAQLTKRQNSQLQVSACAAAAAASGYIAMASGIEADGASRFRHERLTAAPQSPVPSPTGKDIVDHLSIGERELYSRALMSAGRVLSMLPTTDLQKRVDLFQDAIIYSQKATQVVEWDTDMDPEAKKTQLSMMGQVCALLQAKASQAKALLG